MPILGYGEDALTFHAISNGLAGLFQQLGDDSDPARALIFYRPSFGRRSSAPAGSPRSEFGEFDVIIGTSRAVYVVETKWSASGEFDGSNMNLRPEQRRRHKAFHAYVTEWRRQPPTDWATFVARLRPILSVEVPGLVPPADGTTLARNLAYILRRLDACGPNVVDVLLFCRLSDAVPLPSTCDGFCIVTHLCKPEESSRFVRLAD